jgi:putative endonuclease
LIDRKKIGETGEKIACDYLKKNGYRIIETNYRTRFGEIDIVCRKKDTLVFFEVRSKTSLTFGIPEESITQTKSRHLAAAAYHYLQHHKNLPENWRYDFMAIEMDASGKPTRINVIESAIEE